MRIVVIIDCYAMDLWKRYAISETADFLHILKSIAFHLRPTISLQTSHSGQDGMGDWVQLLHEVGAVLYLLKHIRYCSLQVHEIIEWALHIHELLDVTP
jgi:hypothetical protein